ncbi:hypothetical protein KM043_009565 [Ampulex compressa]|nr:hypothetical protein KM043_009565 [Ampulex compressa]
MRYNVESEFDHRGSKPAPPLASGGEVRAYRAAKIRSPAVLLLAASGGGHAVAPAQWAGAPKVGGANDVPSVDPTAARLANIEWRGAPGGGACELRGGTTGSVRSTFHRDTMSPVSPTWSIVMRSKSTGGVHCRRHARAVLFLL